MPSLLVLKNQPSVIPLFLEEPDSLRQGELAGTGSHIPPSIFHHLRMVPIVHRTVIPPMHAGPIPGRARATPLYSPTAGRVST